MKLSATIITLNEEKDLPKCLESLRNLVDEIILVDSGSTDKTVEIAEEFGSKVYYRKFDNYANQKNFASEKASGDWVLSIDADEEISPDLAKEIRIVLKNHKSQFIGYSFPRNNIIFGKFIKYTRWQPELDRHIWLWKRNYGKWVGDVHEELVVNGEVGKLINPKIHNQYKTISEFLDMMNSYSELEAGERVKSGVKFSYIKLFIDPKYNFLVRYVYRLGFLDGWRGFVLSYLMAIYHLELWIKIWERGR
jgi:glycosyltransferase involved in cell wall biosynthesis